MRFNCGAPKDERHETDVLAADLFALKMQLWGKWFAWFPVRVGPRDCRWMEAVLRRYPTCHVDEIWRRYGLFDPINFGTPEYQAIKE